MVSKSLLKRIELEPSLPISIFAPKKWNLQYGRPLYRYIWSSENSGNEMQPK